MKKHAILLALVAALMIGCSDKEKEQQLQQQISQLQTDQDTLKHNLQERDQYIDDVMRSINEVYASLEEARTKEGKLTKGAGSEGPITFRNATSREAMVNNINEIGTTLKENRKRIVGLQQSIRKYNGKIKSLNDMVENLQHSLEEREQAIASFESRVQGLEADVATKTQTITEREAVISDQLKTINTAFYVIGTRDELEQKGIITDEGGFLGFIGSTTIMASGIDQSAFTPIDRTSAQTIEVKGEIDEILPPRKETFYTRTENSDQSQLSITQPERFWQDKYLVIVVDEPQISEVRTEVR